MKRRLAPTWLDIELTKANVGRAPIEVLLWKLGLKQPPHSRIAEREIKRREAERVALLKEVDRD